MYDRFFRGHSAVHIAWIICILSISLVINLSYDFGGNPAISNILNFALGFTSFIIGIFAIIQSALSSASTEKNNSKIQNAVSSLSEPVRELYSSIDELRRVSDSINEKVGASLSSINDLRGYADQLNSGANIQSDDATAQVKTVNRSDTNSEILNLFTLKASPLLRAALITLCDAIDNVQSPDEAKVLLKLDRLTDAQSASFSAILSVLGSMDLVSSVFIEAGLLLDNDMKISNIKSFRENLMNVRGADLLQEARDDFHVVVEDAELYTG